MTKTAVVALGGHALLGKTQEPSIENQLENAKEAMRRVAQLVRKGWSLVITHGNGPQVGHILIRAEAAKDLAYPIPLSVAVAESEGEIGYLIQQTLYNQLSELGLNLPIVTILTQVLVDPQDSAFVEPTKPIGPFMEREQAAALQSAGVSVAEIPNQGWRRVVASPNPLEIIEGDTIRRLVQSGITVIAAGGGGIPVFREQGVLRGVDAVIDKDLASAVLAESISAELLLLLTDVPKVALNYQQSNQVDLDCLTVSEARRYLAEGQFPPGSMGPKVQGAIQFVEKTGNRAIITTPDLLEQALAGQAGTVFAL